MRKIVLATYHILLTCAVVFAGEHNLITRPPLIVGFNVLYGGYKIGEVDFTQSGPYQYLNQTVTELECRVESDAIIEHKGFYRSIVTEDYAVLYLKADVTTAGKTRIDEYNFDYASEKIHLQSDFPGEGKSTRCSIDFSDKDRRYFDMVSLIFRLRDGLDTLTAPFYIPVFVYSRLDSIFIESIIDEPVTGQDGMTVAAKHIRARIPFATFPGIGDRFEIFISDDDNRVPLKAAVQMAVGKIEILPRPRE